MTQLVMNRLAVISSRVETPRIGRCRLADRPRKSSSSDDSARRPQLMAVRSSFFSARCADERVGLDAVTAPEPAVRSPRQGIEDVVFRFVEVSSRRGPLPAGPPGTSSPSLIGMKIRFRASSRARRRGKPNAITGQIRSLIVEGPFSLSNFAVAVGVLVDDDAIAAPLPSLVPVGIRQALDDPTAGRGRRT